LSNSGLADFVGYGSTANCFEGPGPTPNLSNTAAAIRKTNGCTDTDNNASDFQVASPNPRNGNSPGFSCTGSITFRASNYFINESANSLSITVNRTGNVAGPATARYATSDATGVNFNCNPATPGQATGQASRKCDYHIAAGRLWFAPGETSKQIILSLVNDVYSEISENLNISLSDPTGAILGSNSTANISISDNDFSGQPNPIDGTAFYVRMLYVDLLSREPEPAGLAGWVHRIDFCGQPGELPPPCDRVTVGGDGFLRSEEFFDREFFVIRLYRTALGRIPRYDDVGDLAYVSGFLTSADLELNKQELVSEIMSRPEFGNTYNSLGNAQFVDTLIQTAAVTLPAGVRDGWVNALDGSTRTRAQVFRELSERSEVSAKYLHEAQVVSCYYGFFTRNPDGAYLTFLDRLDRGEITLGDLANAFINAAEYRQRFGP
jgi:Calx-beta domain